RWQTGQRFTGDIPFIFHFPFSLCQRLGPNHEETKSTKDGIEPIFSGFLRALRFFVVKHLDQFRRIGIWKMENIIDRVSWLSSYRPCLSVPEPRDFAWPQWLGSSPC